MAYSKSFLSMMVLMLRAILYPNSLLFVTTGGKLLIIIYLYIFILIKYKYFITINIKINSILPDIKEI